MEDFKLFDAEQRFCEIVWENEPVRSTELARLCEEHLGWRKSTTYTVLRKLCGRGILQNRDAVVTSLIRRDQVRQYESEALLDRAFDGSLPAFISAFLRGRRLSAKEADEIRKMIEEAEKK
ncbi:MAG: BlaI/MecI/CopY family transcriptional regulator [Clostridiaceae bacterium]|nr:BlaI/MecI/CopY family transcriptional regulator [Clostridiaceae bacterium]